MRPGTLLLTFELTGEAAAVAVWDTEPRLPGILARDPERHGLEIVTAVCPSFAVHREPVGKRMVAVIPLSDDPVGDMAGPRVSSGTAGVGCNATRT